MGRLKVIKTAVMETGLKKPNNISMMPEKSEKNMQAIQMRRSKIPLPIVEQKRLVQAEVEIGLYLAVDEGREEDSLKMRQVVEWGLKEWLKEAHPEKARKLGLLPPK